MAWCFGARGGVGRCVGDVCRLLLLSPIVMPPTGDAALDAVLGSTHYSVLVPMFLVAAFVTVYLNWLSLKFFRHT